MLTGASLLAIAGGVSAEPMTLTATQMDGVNGGTTVIGSGGPDYFPGGMGPGTPYPIIPSPIIRFIPIVPMPPGTAHPL